MIPWQYIHMSVTISDVTPRNASLGLWRLYSGFQLYYDGGAHAPRDERPIAAQARGRTSSRRAQRWGWGWLDGDHDARPAPAVSARRPY
jgi:hypothetical protein